MVFLNLWDTLTTLMSWLEVLMFYTKIVDTLTSNSTTKFFHEFGINGNQSSGLGSSLIDFKSWLKKPYYYVNCSRVPMEQQNAYRSLQIKGTNSSSLAVDYVIFAIYSKSFSLDVISGNITKTD